MGRRDDVCMLRVEYMYIVVSALELGWRVDSARG